MGAGSRTFNEPSQPPLRPRPDQSTNGLDRDWVDQVTCTIGSRRAPGALVGTTGATGATGAIRS
ncbi:hypothetical protein SAMN05216561_101142 [Nocardioides psychrotolerans]|uniref:Uncharacterized protein n=1 Tax=Nocardioides psychrotolerans TaxID=1005945 RepID=A0A1I3BHM0_9ACTN|nr:hypothetical protein SAMN05216561_101142 [Nocardioides psychrotolerans]